MTRVVALIVWCAVAVAQQPQFRGGVDVVELTVAVLDGKKVVSDMAVKDFQVVDNGVIQDVISVSRELLPIDVTLVIDMSESLSPALQESIVSAANGIRARLKPTDRLSLVSFNSRIQEQLALRPPAQVGAVNLGRVVGQTSLNDAIGVVLTSRPVTDRRQMAIVLTDGYDSTSLLTETDVVALAGRSHTSMFFILREVGASSPSHAFSTPLVQVTASGLRQPMGFFKQVAEATGGLTQIVPSFTLTATTTLTSTQTVMRMNPSLLDEPFLKALDDFRSSYTVRYNLTGVPRPGWHQVSVKIMKPGKTYQVRTRSGYVGG